LGRSCLDWSIIKNRKFTELKIKRLTRKICPTVKRCDCKAHARINTVDNYKLLQFTGDHNEYRTTNDKSTKLKHKEIIAIHDAVILGAVGWYRIVFATDNMFGIELHKNCKFMLSH
jgi:hypothetical protein